MDLLIWIDWVIIVVVIVSSLISLVRGFVKEALSLVTWIAAFLVARTFHPYIQILLSSSIETPSVRLIAAFAILFLGTLVVGGFVNALLVKLIRATGLTSTDRVLGMMFGVARGVVIVVFAVGLLRMTPVTQDTWWQTSLLIPKFGELEQWTRHVFGNDIEQFLGRPV